jgi:hypothetical protein
VLYRFDCALRTAAVLGLVGAGGMGFQIELSLKMMEHGEVFTEILVLFARRGVRCRERTGGFGAFFVRAFPPDISAAAFERYVVAGRTDDRRLVFRNVRRFDSRGAARFWPPAVVRRRPLSTFCAR